MNDNDSIRNHDESFLSASPSPDMSTLTTPLPNRNYEQSTWVISRFPRTTTVSIALAGDRDRAIRHTNNGNQPNYIARRIEKGNVFCVVHFWVDIENT